MRRPSCLRAALALAVVATLAWAFWPENDEDVIRQRLRDVVAGYNEGSQTALRDGLTDDFQLFNGWTKEKTVTTAELAHRLHPNIHLSSEIRAIEVAKDRSTAEVHAVLSASGSKRDGGNIDESDEGHLTFRRDGGTWRLSKVRANVSVGGFDEGLL